jgi:translation initiation factor IF-1
MKLDKNPFSVNMNMVKLEGKRVLVHPSQVETTKGKEVIIGEERPSRLIKPKSPKDGQWEKNGGGGAPQRHPNATFDILMAKYMEGRAHIRGRENRTIRNPKLDSPVSLSQSSNSVAGSLSDKQSRTLPHQKSEGRGHHQ